MTELLLLAVCALLLLINTLMTGRVMSSVEVPMRKNLLIGMIWIAPFVGALIAKFHLPAQPAAPARKTKAPAAGFATDMAPREIALGDGPPFPLIENMGLYNGFPMVNWPALAEWASSLGGIDLQRKAMTLGQRAWLLHFRDALGPHFHLYATDDAYVVSSLEDVVAVATAAYIASTRKRIQRLLAGIAHFDADDKNTLLVVDDQRTYYNYVSAYYPEGGEIAPSGGMFINAGCAHFLAMRADLAAIEPVIAHEMTHSALSHLGLPRWLDEGLAVNTERRLTRQGHVTMRPQELHRKHLAFWGPSEIQEFWSGHSFFRTDDGNLLSYELARVMVEQMSQDRELFTRFALNAQREDGGAEAALKVLGVDLGAYACALFDREPDPAWSPDPKGWGTPEPKPPIVGDQDADQLPPRTRPSPSFSIASCASTTINATSATVTRSVVARVRMCS
ncbi:hypothetical protein SAMN03159363_0824 [Variovorax sp. EL159]|nr:hypothetical protein SAMN03159363_0824 [Variovorax sp. EL159]